MSARAGTRRYLMVAAFVVQTAAYGFGIVSGPTSFVAGHWGRLWTLPPVLVLFTAFAASELARELAADALTRDRDRDLSVMRYCACASNILALLGGIVLLFLALAMASDGIGGGLGSFVGALALIAVVFLPTLATQAALHVAAVVWGRSYARCLAAVKGDGRSVKGLAVPLVGNARFYKWFGLRR